jgi:hypothetical protein
MVTPRQLVVSGTISGVDDETWPFSDELMHQSIQARIVLTAQDIPQDLVTFSKGWGGECRLEVTMTAKLQTAGFIRVEVNGKLFEGTSETTDDLEDEKTLTALVPRGGVPVPFTMQLHSKGLGGGDAGTVNVTFVNSLVDE